MGAAGGLAAVRLRAQAGDGDLYYLDECGFSPTLPTGWTWARTGVRAVVAREDKKDRRVNVLGAISHDGPDPALVWTAVDTKIDADLLLGFVCERIAGLPGGAAALADPPAGWQRARPVTIVLDNASIHHDHRFKDHLGELAAIGVELFYLPPRSPELNRIERTWRSVKYEDMPVRAYTTTVELQAAANAAMTRRAHELTRHPPHLLKTA